MLRMPLAPQIAGLTFPFLSARDPEGAGEGSIDPLGLGPLADRLADEIAPGITARMSRVRFLTAMAISAAALERLRETAAKDGAPSFLALEWIVVEAIARRKDLPSGAQRIPGIDKARAAILRNERLCSRAYLKTPKVFGFHGVYKRLAVALDIVDADLDLSTAGERLLVAWERDQPELAAGFLEADRTRPGGAFRKRLSAAVEDALQAGRVDLSPLSSLQREVAIAFRPDGAQGREKEILRIFLMDSSQPVRQELVNLLAGVAWRGDATDSDYIDTIYGKATPDLRARFDAIRAYEALSAALASAFEVVLCLSTAQGTRPLTLRQVSNHETFQRAAKQAPKLLQRSLSALAALDGELEIQLRTLAEEFLSISSPAAFLETLLRHHKRIQAAKPPAGKLPWYDDAPGGLVVRHAYRMDSEPADGDAFRHPFRLTTVMNFLADLG